MPVCCRNCQAFPTCNKRCVPNYPQDCHARSVCPLHECSDYVLERRQQP